MFKTKYLIIIIAYILVIFIFSRIWQSMFTPKRSKEKDRLKNLKDDADKFNKRNQQKVSYKEWSKILNNIPVLRLTPEKKRMLENSIDSKCNILGYTKPLAEEIHCRQWFIIFLVFIVVSFLIGIMSLLWGKVGLIGVVLYALIPLASKMVMDEYDVTGDKIQSDVVDNHFLEFFEEYYIQYQTQKPALELSSVLRAYAQTCCPDMVLFCSTFMSDIHSLGPETAIQMLSRRYRNSTTIARFSAVAQAINAEEAGAEDEMNSFLDNLMQEQYIAQEKNIEKQDAKLDREISVLITGLLMSLMAILLISFKNMI